MHPLNGAPKMIGAAVAAVSFLLMQLLCDRIADPFRPFSHSTATLAGYVYDAITERPVGGASVKIDNREQPVITDDGGKFRFDNVPTGKKELTITSAKHQIVHAAVDVTLETDTVIYHLERKNEPPAINSIIVSPGTEMFFNDPVKIVFNVNDSSGGITGAILHTGDTGSAGRKELVFDSLYAVCDSFTYSYTSPGKFAARLVFIGARGDSGAGTITFVVSPQRRPSFRLLRTSPEGFIIGAPGYLQVIVDDPDSLFSHLSINWGDGGDPAPYFGHQGTYWHTYQVEKDSLMPIAVTLFCDTGMVNDTTVLLPVVKIDPPLLDGNLFFEPCQYCAPHDTAILIGVQIKHIEGWVRQIIWIVNENDPEPAFDYWREDYNENTGAVIDSIGNTFVHRFSTAGFKGSNIVQIRVVDSFGNSSTVSGNFYIAGKPD